MARKKRITTLQGLLDTRRAINKRRVFSAFAYWAIDFLRFGMCSMLYAFCLLSSVFHPKELTVNVMAFFCFLFDASASNCPQFGEVKCREQRKSERYKVQEL